MTRLAVLTGHMHRPFCSRSYLPNLNSPRAATFLPRPRTLDKTADPRSQTCWAQISSWNAQNSSTQTMGGHLSGSSDSAPHTPMPAGEQRNGTSVDFGCKESVINDRVVGLVGEKGSFPSFTCLLSTMALYTHDSRVPAPLSNLGTSAMREPISLSGLGIYEHLLLGTGWGALPCLGICSEHRAWCL